jgi:Arc/MetJ family transcription regulator
MSRTRTNIEIDDNDLARVMQRYNLRTKTEAVALALRKAAGPRPMTKDEALAMRGAHYIEDPPGEHLMTKEEALAMEGAHYIDEAPGERALRER